MSRTRRRTPSGQLSIPLPVLRTPQPPAWAELPLPARHVPASWAKCADAECEHPRYMHRDGSCTAPGREFGKLCPCGGFVDAS